MSKIIRYGFEGSTFLGIEAYNYCFCNGWGWKSWLLLSLLLLFMDIQKSGRKIKAKVSKIPLSQVNQMPMIQIRHTRNSSAPIYNPPDDQLQSVPLHPAMSAEESEKKELLNYFGIPENYQWMCSSVENKYYHQISKERMMGFGNVNNLNLDVRDERIKLPYQNQYLQVLIKSNFTENIDPLLDSIRDWLIDLIQIVTSISFNHLRKGHLSNQQAKNFAAKNLLLNIKEMFEKIGALPLAHRYEIMRFVNQSTLKIMQNSILKYPQTGSKGASRRIKSKIHKIDNRECDQYDFLRKNDIKINYRKSGDYSQQIMKVLNRLVSFAGDNFHPNNELEETNFEVFTQVVQFIFENCSSQNIENTVADVYEILQRKMRSKDDSILNLTNISELRDALSFSDRLQKKSSYSKQLANKDYMIGQKVPPGTEIFTDEEIEGSNFKINDSSVLRILTKWGEQLRAKLENAEEAITKRAYKFKMKGDKFINLDMDLREQLYFAAHSENKKIANYMEFLNKENTYLQALLAEEQNIAKYCKQDTKVGIYAAKINEIASQYIFKYVNKLIGALLNVPREASKNSANEAEKYLLSSVDLLTLKIGDLMRCKFSCTEQEFIKVMAVLQEFDCKHPEILKIIRVKDRLDKKDNDVLINVYFMDKVECEIQLSIKGLYNKSQKDYSNFNHFIYEIIRSELGPLSELANIICQYDPFIHNFKRRKQFSPEILTGHWIKTWKKQVFDTLVDRLKFKKKMGLAKCLDLPFICWKCMHLTIVNNPKFYNRNPADPKLICNYCKECDIKDGCKDEAYSYMADFSFKDDQTKQFFKNHADFWDFDAKIKDMAKNTNQEECDMLDIPMQGFYIKKTNKVPKISLYTAAYDEITNSFIFVNVDKKGNKKLISKLPLYFEKSKTIESMQQSIGKFYLFSFVKVRREIVNGELLLTCSDPACCGKQAKAGYALTPQQIIDIKNCKVIACSLQNQKNILNLNKVSNALELLDTEINKISDMSKVNRVIRSVQHIKLVECSLKEIVSISKFSNIRDLTITDNRNLKSLRGLEDCRLINNLEAKNCDIEDLTPLAQLSKIQYLNLSGNRNLKKLSGLEKNTQLSQINLSFTAIQTLIQFQNCHQIQSLHLQNCSKLLSINEINSPKLTYLNIIDCTSLREFDLPKQSSVSLRSVQYFNKSKEKLAFEIIFASFNAMQDEEQHQQKTNINFEELTVQINEVLELNRKQQSNLFSMFISK